MAVLRLNYPASADSFPVASLTVSNAPGCRDVTFHLTFDGAGAEVAQIELRLAAGDTQALLSELLHIHRFSWCERNGPDDPIDVKDGEQRPTWIPK